MKERRPNSNAWKRVEDLPALLLDSGYSVWRSRRIRVISALEMAEMPDGSGDVGPTWHVSVSTSSGGEASDAEMQRVRLAFGMTEAEEDNHEPGRARNLWLVVDPARRVACECKTTETIVVEENGHTWSSPPDEIEERRALIRAIRMGDR